MLTPRFKLSQDEHKVFLTVHAPYTNVGDTEIDVDGENVLFVSSPYFLRLRLPGRILDNDSKGSYSCDTGEFTLTFDKESPGEHFDNLDMITSLLAPRDIPDINPSLVEMLEEDGITLEEDVIDDGPTNFAYGFANKISTEFREIGTEFPQIFELRVPEQVPIIERNDLRIKYENSKFSSDHYFADLYDNELLEPYVTSKGFCEDLDKNIDFTDEEVGILKDLPNKHYLLSSNEHKQVLNGMIDILFAYCYDKRTTLNESTVESSWTINKLSSTLSWFCTFETVKETLIACFRRSITFPIFRNFDLSSKVKNDLVSVLRKGKKMLIKCFIDIHHMFNNSNDARYILNQLYVKDYLVFIQKCRNEDIDELCNNIANIDIQKNDLGLDLEELEAAADMVQMEQAEIVENAMAVQMASMSLLSGLNNNVVNGDSDDDDDSESSYDSSSESDSSDSDSTSESDELDSDDNIGQ